MLDNAPRLRARFPAWTTGTDGPVRGDGRPSTKASAIPMIEAPARQDTHAPSTPPVSLPPGGVTGFLLVCLAWLLVRPYQGVRHDGILYLGQAFHLLRPDILGADLFFSHGSQDRFTMVTGPFAWLLSRFGVAAVEMALTAAGNLAFVAAAWALSAALAPSRRWLCAASVALLSHGYAVLAIFNYGENFFTARSVAEPLVLLGLAAWIRQRFVAGGLLFLAAAVAHPLVALPALVTAWMLQVLQDRRWLWALAVLAPVAGLAAAGIGPFGGLFARFDDPWWNAVGALDSQVRMTLWQASDLVSAGLDLALLGIAATLLPLPRRRFVQALLASSGLLVTIAFVGGDLARDVLLVQLQLWRVLWLAHAVAVLCLPLILLERWRAGGAARLAAAAAAAAVLTVSWALPHAWIFLAWLALMELAARRASAVSPHLASIALAATVLAITAVTAVLAVATWQQATGDAVLASVGDPVVALLAIPTLGALALAAAWWLLRRLPAWGAAALVAALLVAFLPRWDQRSQWTRTAETIPFGQHPFDAFVPPGAQVYWHLELLPTCAMLGRASWVSPNQGAGIVFNRDTALEFARRSAPAAALMSEQVRCQMTADSTAAARACRPSQATVEALCRFPRGPDFMVFDAAYPRGMVAWWDYEVARGTAPRRAYLYDCARIRRDGPAA